MPADRTSTVAEHVERIVSSIEPLTPYDQPLLEAIGLPVCETVSAGIDLPSFDNSAMDGYAVHAEDVASATADQPVHLPVVGELAAGQSQLIALSPGTTARIMTGAPVPQGADAIVPVEWTDGGVASVRIDRAPRIDEHVRHRGEDVQAGDLLLEEGTVLGPRELGLLASVGRDQVRSRPRPRVVVMSTGAELREPGTALGHDSIFDTNSYMLAAAARSVGAIAYRVGIVSDDAGDFAEALSDQLVRADLVVTSGGISKGAYDVVKEVLAESGTVSFGEVAMQPGKPQGFGFVGEDATPILTLPGNPVSSYVSFEVFVLPAIRRLMGRQPYRRPPVTAVCVDGFSSAPGREQFVRARFEGEGAVPRVHAVGGHGSHLMGGLSEANALIDVPAGTTYVESGTEVQVLVLDREF